MAAFCLLPYSCRGALEWDRVLYVFGLGVCLGAYVVAGACACACACACAGLYGVMSFALAKFFVRLEVVRGDHV